MTVSESNEREIANQWLAAELNRIWLVAERALRSLQEAQIRPGSDHPSLAEVEGILAARRAARSGRKSKPENVATLTRAIQEVEATLPALRQAAPIGRIIKNLALSAFEVETLVSTMAPHIDAPLADLYMVLKGQRHMRPGVDLALLAQMFQLGRADRVALLDTLDPNRPLLRWHLIQAVAAESAEAFGSLTHRAIRPTFQLISMLCGRGELDPALARSSQVSQTAATLDDLSLSDELRPTIERACNAAAAFGADPSVGFPWLALWGPAGVGKKTVARKIAAYAGKPLITFNPTMLDQGTFVDLLHRVQCEALVRDAMLYIGPLPAKFLEDGARAVTRRIAGYNGMVALGVDEIAPPRIMASNPIQEIRVTLPPEPIRRALWNASVPENLRDADVRLDSLSTAFNLTPGEIVSTAAESLAIAKADKGRKVTHADLRVGVERRLRNDLGDLARRLPITVSWDELVLPAQQMARIQEFISRKKHKNMVYSEWGFGQRVGYAKGLIGLFSGPPGTGKTMLALLVAKSLDLDVYQVDLSQVMSKWVGETEKQLGKVFDQAERAHAVLLFDEADSLFSKRTEVKTSNDRYGNLAVNYLLQRLEQYEGVAILTTNKEASLDDALQRRLSMHLHLEIPEVAERRRLWQSFIPEGAPRDADLDFMSLAREFKLSGGYIKNAAVRAAFLAAARGVPIGMGLLHLASGLELEDMGRVVWRSDAAADELTAFGSSLTDG